MLDYNIKRFNLMIKNNRKMFFSSKILIKMNKNAILQLELINNTKKIIKNLNQLIKKTKYIKL